MEIPWWDTTLGEQAIATAAVLSVIAALLIIGRITVKYLHPIVKKFTALYDKIMGRDPNPRYGDLGEPGLFVQLDRDREEVKQQIIEVRKFVETRLAEQDELLATQNVQVSEIKAHVTPNHGSTKLLADLVQDLDAKMDEHLKEVPSLIRAAIEGRIPQKYLDIDPEGE